MLRIVRAALALAGALLCLWAAAGSYRRLRGDLIVYAVPPPNREMNVKQAVALQSRLNDGIRLNPLGWEPYVFSANFYAIQRDYPSALKRLAQARVFYTAYKALELEGRLLLEKGDLAGALEKYETLHRISVVDRGVVRDLVRLYSRAGRYKEMMDLIREAEARWPGSPDLLVSLGNAHLDEGSKVLALKYYLLGLATSAARAQGAPSSRVYNMEEIRAGAKNAAKEIGSRADWARLK